MAYQSPTVVAVRPTAQAPDLLGLLRAIKQKPEDDARRHILADWLEERGDRRGTLVRLQCELAALPLGDARRTPLERRAEDLFRMCQDEWLGPLIQLVEAYGSRRGLLQLEFKARKFFSKPVAGWVISDAAAWLDKLTLYDITMKEAIQLGKLPLLAHLNGLHLGGSVGSKGLQALLDSPHLPHLRELDLGAAGLGPADMRALAASPLLDQLAVLRLNANKIGDTGLQALVSSPRVARLATLELVANDITETGIRALANSQHLARLARLDLSSNYLLDAGVIALADSPHLAGLRSLRLYFTAVGSDSADAIATSKHMANLIELDLTGNGGMEETKGVVALRNRLGNNFRI